VGLDTWLQDLEQAKRLAAQEKKDILIVFDGSDWCGFSMRLAKEVLLQPAFQQQTGQRFVFVRLDFPKKDAARAKVQDAERNARLRDEFHVEGYPHLVLADARGRPYASVSGYKPGGADAWNESLEHLQDLRSQRDYLVAAVVEAKGVGQLEAAKRNVLFLEE